LDEPIVEEFAMKMKMIRNVSISLGAVLFCAALVSAQDLSKYRQFSLGTSLTEVSKQVGQRTDQATVVQTGPATIQEIEWWPVAVNFLAKREPVQKVIFTFYNRTLYKIVATYDSEATTGLTDSDMVQAISTSYGPPAQAAPAVEASKDTDYDARVAIAQWDDAKHSVRLSRESFLNAFRLVVLAKELNAQADASMADVAAQARADAPQREIDRDKKAADDLATVRQANLKAFRP
jgi:hypothetical protein